MTTPTGKAMARVTYTWTHPRHRLLDGRNLEQTVLAIEQEAAAAERRSIRAMCKERNPDHDDRWCRICTDMVDPVDDPDPDR